MVYPCLTSSGIKISLACYNLHITFLAKTDQKKPVSIEDS